MTVVVGWAVQNAEPAPCHANAAFGDHKRSHTRLTPIIMRPLVLAPSA